VAANLAAALVGFQSDVPPIPRSKTVKVTTKTGGSYTFAYAPLEAILPAIQPVAAKHGLAWSQLLSSSADGRPMLRTLLLHVGSAERLESEFPMPLKGGESAQEIGSMISYLRRYALVSMLGLSTDEDDDANHASGNSVAPAGGVSATERPSSVPPEPAGATDPQRVKMAALRDECLAAGLISDDVAAKVTQSVADPDLSREKARGILDALKKKQDAVTA